MVRTRTSRATEARGSDGRAAVRHVGTGAPGEGSPRRCTALDALRVRGFTMLELLVVLVIIAIVSAVSIPVFTGTSNAEMKSAARQLASGLRLARSTALAQRRETFSCSTSPDVASRSTATPASIRCRATSSLKLFTAQKDLVDDKVGAIRFYPDGGSNGGRITLAAGERKYEVDVDWLTGRVAILD